MLLIKNAKVYAPEYVGKKDLLVCGGKIECIDVYKRQDYMCMPR